MIVRLLCALEGGQGGGDGRVLRGVADTDREYRMEAMPGCTARSTILAGVVDALGGDLLGLPVMNADAPIQWSNTPPQLQQVVRLIQDKSGAAAAAAYISTHPRHPRCHP